MSQNILAGLNPEQIEAVTTTEGPVLILAGAGSGKTKALTHRIAYLVMVKKIHPENVLAVTFTNKAAEEMKSRVNVLLSANMANDAITATKLPWLGTFHSICAKILRSSITVLGYTRSFNIYDQTDSLVAIKHAMDKVGIDKKQYNPRTIQNYISGAKNELLSPSDYANFAKGHFGEVTLQVYQQYQKDLKLANSLDFDDLLMKTVELLGDKAILERFQDQFRYILIDEYQDTNFAQYRFSQLLAQKYKNICVVGDDAQAIYGFRGANFKNILDFERDYPKAKVIKMEQNYRSTKKIIASAQNVIEKNTLRSEKKLWTNNEEGLTPTVFEARNEKDEANFILDEVESLKSFGGYNQFVILYRTNAQSRIFEEALMQASIPYRLIGALRFYERREVKDILAYLKLIVNPTDRVAQKRIINVPPRGIGDKTANLENHPKVLKFKEMMEDFRLVFRDLKISELIDLVTLKSAYKDWVLDGTEEGEGRWENIEELKSVAEQSEDLESFLEQITLVSDIDNFDPSADAVTLMTLHNAKGLEFPIVFMVGMEENLLPHANSLMEPSDLEEERRLCYVGITRAEKRLYFTYATSRMIFGSIQANAQSRFLFEISEEFLDRI
ncbi:MAG: UvrD-helicase domain-containing protein [Patescibacteria group bacterium]